MNGSLEELGLGIHLTIDPTSITSTIPSSSTPSLSPEQRLSLKLFLFHLLAQLHSSGNLTYRTEKYIYRVGKKYGIHATATILFRRAILSFQELQSLESTSSETYTIAIKSGWKYGNLILLDQLCFEILQRDLSFEQAQQRLEEISQNPWSYSWQSVMLAFGCSSFGATTLFFGGTWIDGGWAFLFGLLAYYLDYLSEKLTGLSEISCFVTSFILSVIATIIDLHIYHGSSCLFGQLFGAVVWLLPGITITIGLLEIYSQMPMYGSARLVYGISLASQLGFGLVLGSMLASQSRQLPDSFINGCRDPVSVYYAIILLPLIAASFAVLISSTYRQIPGMTVTCTTGFLTSYIAFNAGADPSVIPFIAAIAVTIVGRIYAYLDGNQRPFTFIMTGLMVLVPGGVGVRGMSDMWSGDSQLGMEVTFKMLLIGVSLAMGHFIALIPSQKWFLVKVQKKSNPQKLFGDVQFSILNPISASTRHRMESMDGGI
jgi:uncharacterized membrane protein YjjP (DUF1212 family)